LAALTATAGLLALLGQGNAGAATQLGQTFDPITGCGTSTRFQSVSPGDQYVAPSAGVITSWSFQASGSPPQLKFKVGRRAGGNDFTVVGESAAQAPSASVLNTYPARVPVAAGDVIGIDLQTLGDCATTLGPGSGFTSVFKPGDQALGTTGTYTAEPNIKNDVSAILEPDADADAFGDETQDKCLGTPGTANGCPSSLTLDKLKAKGSKVQVTVSVPGAGSLTAGSAAAKGKPLLKPVSVDLTATSKQTMVLKLKLTKAARRKLDELGNLKVAVKAVYTPPGGVPGSQQGKAKLRS
jgi:hypothetical protein